MTMNEAQMLEKSYYNWLKNDGLSFSKLDNDYVAIVTPFLDKKFDNISIYARIIDNNVVELSDFGYTLFDLEEEKSGNTLQKILQVFGITLQDNTLVIKTSIDKFPIAQNRMLQAILKINDLS